MNFTVTGTGLMMSIVPSGTQVVYKSSPSFSTPGDKPKITPSVLPTSVQCSSSLDFLKTYKISMWAGS
jgi:hypothetical protein